nr:hypothetical protein [Delftia acidovorans]
METDGLLTPSGVSEKMEISGEKLILDVMDTEYIKNEEKDEEKDEDILCVDLWSYIPGICSIDFNG